MKKSLAIAAIALGSVVVIGGGIAVYVLMKDDFGGEPSDTTTNASDTGGTEDVTGQSGEVIQPDLDIVITDYPTYVENDCQYVSYTATLTNSGPVDLDYEDIQSGKYAIAVSNNTPDGSTYIVGTTFDDRVTFSGVQSIPVGESIEITVVPGRDYENSFTGEIQHDNEMGHGTGAQNGDFGVVMELWEVNDDDSYSILSKSEPVTVTIDVWEDPSESMLKFCE
jgi:hypothetical protein